MMLSSDFTSVQFLSDVDGSATSCDGSTSPSLPPDFGDFSDDAREHGCGDEDDGFG